MNVFEGLYFLTGMLNPNSVNDEIKTVIQLVFYWCSPVYLST